MTREEIAQQELNGEELDFFGDNMGNLFDCMDAFAKQEVATATHPLQEKIDGLREALTIIVDVTGHTAGEVYMMQDIAKQALETYK